MYEIDRGISFCYGHRLLEHPGKCANLHGHTGLAVFVLAAPELDSQGMVTDFQTVRETVGRWIERELDHRMILHRSDPALPALRDLGEPVVVVDFHPTAENLARMLYDRAREFDLPVTHVRLFESPTCSATYRPEQPA
jgi:6-pyruvoyltetrahydropterin/6-carboxytetrahydropterin synthase